MCGLNSLHGNLKSLGRGGAIGIAARHLNSSQVRAASMLRMFVDLTIRSRHGGADDLGIAKGSILAELSAVASNFLKEMSGSSGAGADCVGADGALLFVASQ